MDNKGIDERWNEKKGRLKQKWGALTDEDLRYSKEEEDKMVDRIQEKTGKSEEEVRRIIREA